jgi:[ribosomal protein S18]-alanine N-acetyltransferase
MMTRTAESGGAEGEVGGIAREEVRTSGSRDGEGPPPPAVRPARVQDLERILEVEQASFSTPWGVRSFQALLEREDVRFLVLEEEGRVVGHGILWWVREEGEVANLAVAPEWRGRGGGARLLDALLDEARAAGVERVFLEVRVSNRAAARLYGSRGFRPMGIRRNYYTQPREDARVLKLILPDPGEPKP